MLLLRHDHLPIYKRLMRTDRPIGTWLVLWPTLWALWLAAEGIPPIKLLVVFSLGAFLMRSAGCVINDYADRHYDGHVARTRSRPLAQGEIPATEAVQLFVIICLLAASLLLFTNLLTALLAVGAVALASIYPFMKRYTHLPQVVLGMAFSWSVPMAYAAVNGELSSNIWLVYVAVVLWVVAYDTFYAMVDRDDDITAGIKSTAVLFGRYDRLITSVLQLVFILLMVLVGRHHDLGLFFYASLSITTLLFIYQQTLIAQRDGPDCFKAFLNNNYVGTVIFLGIAAHYLFD